MILEYKHLNADLTSPPIVIIHGLFGSMHNWNMIAKALANENQILLVDCRNHGKSFHNDSMSYQEMAHDITMLLDHLNLTNAILIGHSMGGKIAMAFSQIEPSRVIKQIIIDIAPKQYPDHHTSIIKHLLSIDLSHYSSRSAVSEVLKSKIPNEGLRQFLIKNIEPKQPLKWQINLQAIANNYHQIMNWPTNLTKESLTDTLFIQGTESNYITKSDIPIIKKMYKYYDIKSIKTSHWVHAEKPAETISLINEFL